MGLLEQVLRHLMLFNEVHLLESASLFLRLDLLLQVGHFSLEVLVLLNLRDKVLDAIEVRL